MKKLRAWLSAAFAPPPINREPTLYELGMALIMLHRQGYKPVRGYTIRQRDDPWKGAIYVAVAAVREDSK